MPNDGVLGGVGASGAQRSPQLESFSFSQRASSIAIILELIPITYALIAGLRTVADMEFGMAPGYGTLDRAAPQHPVYGRPLLHGTWTRVDLSGDVADPLVLLVCRRWLLSTFLARRRSLRRNSCAAAVVSHRNLSRLALPAVRGSPLSGICRPV